MKTTSKKAIKKELEANITGRFMQALTDLGHDAEKVKKEVKKFSKALTKKINKKYDEIKTAVADNFETEPVKKAVKKATKSAQKAKKDVVTKVEEVEKVLNKATKVAGTKATEAITPKIDVLQKTVAETAEAVKDAVKRVSKKPAAGKTNTMVNAEQTAKPNVVVKAKTVKKV